MSSSRRAVAQDAERSIMASVDRFAAKVSRRGKTWEWVAENKEQGFKGYEDSKGRQLVAKAAVVVLRRQ
ncbi:hypothetical protein CBOM_04212 [Ceraceosorus bombacis]|uniref:Uncharacterized protein n=1 Tax=Ceraceosorus bombacis TaxID=401625 RepID=A0A0P1BNN3_9BASI|nr:hypothetical protein CBOM_04212 [Ceraceosorus bombacis]